MYLEVVLDERLASGEIDAVEHGRLCRELLDLAGMSDDDYIAAIDERWARLMSIRPRHRTLS